MQHDPDATSLTLLHKAAAHDQIAWKRLTEVYGPLVYHWCRKYGLSPEDSADIFQDVFRSVANRLGDYRKRNENDKFRAWLWTITRNKMRDLARRKQTRPDATGGSEAYAQLGQVPSEEPEEISETAVTGVTKVVRETLDMVKSEFKERTWNAFWRVAIDGRSASLVADELSISVDSVYQAKSRVLRRLRKELGEIIVTEWTGK